MTAAVEVDHAAVERLANDLMTTIRDHLNTPITTGTPPDTKYVLESLNALAITTAVVLAGTGNHDDAHQFFQDALIKQLGVIA